MVVTIVDWRSESRKDDECLDISILIDVPVCYVYDVSLKANVSHTITGGRLILQKQNSPVNHANIYLIAAGCDTKLKTGSRTFEIPHGNTVTPHQHLPYFKGDVITVEAENFTMESNFRKCLTSNCFRLTLLCVAGSSSGKGCRQDVWSPCEWGVDDNMFSSDVSNVFHSRQAYLHADANAPLGATAEAMINVNNQAE